MAGCKALNGQAVSEIAEEIGMSRQYVYEQKAKAAEYVASLDKAEPEVPVLKLDKKTIDRMILSLALDCQAPYDGIVRFFDNAICEKGVSAGYISELLAKASERAEQFDRQIDLSGIRQGANDEIFQCGIPILTGVDPESTYTYLLEEATDRTADTWELYLDDRKDQGLNLETSINDGATGLMAGVRQAFPEVQIQADTFHAMQTLGREVSKLERQSHKLIGQESALEANLAGKKPRAKNKERLAQIRPEVAVAISLYDKIFILFTWLKEMLSFSGYSMAEAMILSEWILREMNELSESNPGLRSEITKVQKMLPSLLSFIGRLEREMELVAKEARIPVEGFHLMYRQKIYAPGSRQNSEIHCKQVSLLAEQYPEVRSKFEQILRRTKKASSLVENLNGRIRVFIEVKRVIPPRFFILLKVYFNTRRFHRSRYSERVGKSPLELLTGCTQPDFFDAIGY